MIDPNSPRYNPPGLLIGPIPRIKNVKIINGKESIWWVPDYSHPGVKERIAIEVDMIEDMCWVRGRD